MPVQRAEFVVVIEIIYPERKMKYKKFPRLTGCVTRAGADGGTPSNGKKAEAKKRPENAQTPQRRVHAVLGAFIIQVTLVVVSF